MELVFLQIRVIAMGSSFALSARRFPLPGSQLAIFKAGTPASTCAVRSKPPVRLSIVLDAFAPHCRGAPVTASALSFGTIRATLAPPPQGRRCLESPCGWDPMERASGHPEPRRQRQSCDVSRTAARNLNGAAFVFAPRYVSCSFRRQRAVKSLCAVSATRMAMRGKTVEGRPGLAACRT